jgi:hypothetical protein
MYDNIFLMINDMRTYCVNLQRPEIKRTNLNSKSFISYLCFEVIAEIGKESFLDFDIKVKDLESSLEMFEDQIPGIDEFINYLLTHEEDDLLDYCSGKKKDENLDYCINKSKDLKIFS